MYKFTSKLKLFSFILMAIGFLGIAYGFYMAPKNVEEVKERLKHDAEHGHGGHASSHDTSTSVLAQATTEEVHQDHDSHAHDSQDHSSSTDTTHQDTTSHEHHGEDHNAHNTDQNHHETHQTASHHDGHGAAHADAHHDGDHHAEHLMHLQQNRPWSALYVAMFFFFMISLGALAFYAIQHASQAGWPVVLFRVMEAIASYLPYGAVAILIFLGLSTVGHMNHVFAWTNPELLIEGGEKYDKLLAGKAGWLNSYWFVIRGIIYVTGWTIYLKYSRKLSIAQDNASDNKNYTKLFKASAAFLVFFLVTESMMSWDWIMSIDHHWFSTLFGWYVFAGMVVCAITTMALVTIYLKTKGYLEYVNDSHLHDLAKFMFGFSVFWTYLWFSQFMLIWYANIPEESVYFIARFNEYQLPFIGMIGLNFIFPLLLLMNSDYKRVPWFICLAGFVILFGHYVDLFVMIMPGSVGDQWFIGIPEIGALLFFLGLFIFIVFTTLSKAPLLAKGNPFIHESEHFHY